MQPRLFADVPEGFDYRIDFVSRDEERELMEAIARIEFSRVEMRGAVARRRTAQYGWTYGYERRTTEPGAPIPEFLLPLRARVADWAEMPAEAFAEALVTEYPAGAPIGWHRDAPMFEVIAGISLGSGCRMKFRPYLSPTALAPGAPPRRTTHQVALAPRSAYLIRGAARRAYEHSIPPVAALRYSVTFRTLRSATKAASPPPGLAATRSTKT
jgi:alkylated DNA repair dioxygenase AlkB